MKKLALLLSLALGSAWAKPLYLAAPVNQADVYLKIPSQWQILMLQDEFAQLKPEWEKIKSALSEKNIIPEEVEIDKFIKQWAKLENGLEIIVLGDKAIISGQIQNQNEWEKILFDLFKDSQIDTNKQTIRDGSRLLCYDFNPENKRFMITDHCQNKTLSKERNEIKELIPIVEQYAPQNDDFLFWFKNNPKHYAHLDKESLAMVKHLELDKIESFIVSYQKQNENWTLNFAIEGLGEKLGQLFVSQSLPNELKINPHHHSFYHLYLPDGKKLGEIFGKPFQEIRSAVQLATKIDIEKLFTGFSGQWSLINTPTGSILIHPKNQGSAFDAFVNHLNQLKLANIRTLKDGTTEIKLIFPEKSASFISGLFLPNPFYYRENGEFRYFASLPQILNDYENDPNKISLKEYLEQDIPPSAYFGLAKIPHLDQKHYHQRLKWLNVWADLTGENIDLTTFTHSEFKPMGKIQARTEYQNKRFKFNLDLENGIGDIFLTDDWQSFNRQYFSVAGIGIMAAIALPAYQDYIARAQATEVFRTTTGLQTDIAVYFMDKGTFEGINQEKGIQEVLKHLQGKYFEAGSVAIDEEDGSISIVISSGTHTGYELVITPETNQKTGQILKWTCSGLNSHRYIPSACRNW